MVSNLNLMESRRRILLNTPHLESLSGSTLSFKTDMASKLKECKIHFTPIQEGSGDPSPDNVRPIHGWDGVTVTRCGKNLLDTSQLRTGYYIDANGNENAHAQFGYTISYTPVKENTVYTLSGNIGNHASAYGAVYCYNKNKEFIDRLGGFKTNELPHTFTTPEGTAYVNVQYAIFNSAPQNVQIELGSTATTYEPYKPITTLTIPFPQTIYGGYVDLVKGEVVETHTSPTSWTATKGGAVNQYGFITYKADQSYVRSTSPSYRKCNTISKFGTIIINNVAQRQCEIASGSVYVALPEGEDVNDIQVVYRVATPLIHAITPETIKALRGLNNLWSDANGNIEIKFWAH